MLVISGAGDYSIGIGGMVYEKEVTAMKYKCSVCGWEYDEKKGYPEGGIAPGTPWEQVPDDFECPVCSVGKDEFETE